MTENWHQLKPSQLVPPGVAELTSVYATLTSTLTASLEVSKATLEIAQALADVASTDVLETTLQALLNELKAFIDGLASGTTAHSIFVPIQKQPFGLGVEPPSKDVAVGDRTPSYDSFAESNGLHEDDEHPVHLVDFINSASTAVGGNRGVWKQLLLSLRDEGDESRPEFPDNFAVAGVAILFGAENVRDMMKQARLFQSVLKHNPRADLTARIEPVPTNVRVRIVPDPLTQQIGVILEWDVIPPVQNPSLFSSELLIVSEIFIIRTKNAELRENFSWSEIFSAQPADGAALPHEGDYQVVSRIQNDGFIRKYVDTVDLEPGTTYYYALACRYTLDGIVQPMGGLSGVVRMNYTGHPVASRRSEAPDWMAVPSLLELFPVLNGYLNKAKLTIEGLTSRTLSAGGPSGALAVAVTQLDKEVTRLDKINTELTAVTDRMQQLLAIDPGGIYTLPLVVTEGGMEAWMAALAKALSDPEDPARPPFDHSELVGGVFVLAGAPNLPDLSAFQALLGLFFGSADANPLLDAISSVETAVAATEGLVFDEGLTAISAAAVPEPDIPASIVFTKDMTPTPTSGCD